MWNIAPIGVKVVVPITTLCKLIRQHHFAFITKLPWYRMPSLNFIFRDLDMAAVHLSAIVGTLTGSGLHVK